MDKDAFTCVSGRSGLLYTPKRLFITIRENLEEMYFEGEPRVLVEWFRQWEVKVGVPKCAIMHLRKGELPDTE